MNTSNIYSIVSETRNNISNAGDVKSAREVWFAGIKKINIIFEEEKKISNEEEKEKLQNALNDIYDILDLNKIIGIKTQPPRKGDREITCSTYKRAQRALHKDVNSWFGREMNI